MPLATAQSGDEIVSANNLYGGTFTLFDAMLPQLGIHVRMIRVNCFDEKLKPPSPRTHQHIQNLHAAA